MIVFDKLRDGEVAIFADVASRQAVIVSWLLLPTNDDLSTAVISIARSYSPEDEFVTLAEFPATRTFYRDAKALLRDKWREVYYRLTITDANGKVEIAPVVSVRSHPTLDAIAMRRRADFALRLEGIPVMVYLRRDTGARCPTCWDPVLKKVWFSTCPACFNTGRLGGFYRPILTQVQINPVTKQNEPSETLRQVEQSTAKMSYFPIVKPRDILYEVNSGKRWRIVNQQQTENHRVLIHQDLALIGLNPGDIEHQLPIPSDIEPVLQPRNSQFIEADVMFQERHPVVKDGDSDDVEFIEVY